MKTKLVYVLTCSPEGTYIEQALMSVWSARYYNPDAWIVLVTDDITNQLLCGKREEILNYISEKTVISFDVERDAHYRSRWLKTSLRELVKGDYLFIDCDTIVNQDLSQIEEVKADIALGRDENINLADEDIRTLQPIIDACRTVGVDISRELCYFNSGVMFVKDTPLTHQVYSCWHRFWEEGLVLGIRMDQPSFAKANIHCGRPVVLLHDKWNCIVYTQIKDIYDNPYILHFWHGISFLYSPAALLYIRDNGMNDFVKWYVLNPTETFIPFDNHVCHYRFKEYYGLFRRMKHTFRRYGQEIDKSFKDLEIRSRIFFYARRAIAHEWYGLGALLIVMHKWYYINISGKFQYKENFYEAYPKGEGQKAE